MKIALEYPVDATIHIGEEIRLVYQNKEYVFLSDTKGNLKAIRIISSVDNPKRFATKFESSGKESGADFTINMGNNPPSELIAEFQELESVLSFETEGALRRVIWNKPIQEFIPESDSDKTFIAVHSLQLEKSWPRTRAKLSKSTLSEIINTKDKYHSLVIPKSFYREGIIEYEEFRYINAFRNFYYILEDLYGGGKTKNKDIINEMGSSPELRKTMEWALKNVKEDAKHYSALKKLADSEKITLDVDCFIGLLVRIRGRTHHFTSRGGKRYPTVFDHEKYRSIAWITLGIAAHVILSRIVIINTTQTHQGARGGG